MKIRSDRGGLLDEGLELREHLDVRFRDFDPTRRLGQVDASTAELRHRGRLACSRTRAAHSGRRARDVCASDFLECVSSLGRVSVAVGLLGGVKFGGVVHRVAPGEDNVPGWRERPERNPFAQPGWRRARPGACRQDGTNACGRSSDFWRSALAVLIPPASVKPGGFKPGELLYVRGTERPGSDWRRGPRRRFARARMSGQ